MLDIQYEVHEYENKTRNTPAILVSIYHALRKHRTQLTINTPFLLCCELVDAVLRIIQTLYSNLGAKISVWMFQVVGTCSYHI